MFKIVKDTNQSIREKSSDVDLPPSKDDIKLLKNMINYLKLSQDEKYAEKHNIRPGVGLAAPQIGINRKMIAIYYELDEKNKVELGLINPRIVSNSIKECYLKNGEGCLSVDEDHKGYVYRYFKITVKAFDVIQNKDIEIVARGYDAIVLQHEIDHLSGILYYDRIDKKNPFLKKDNSIEI